MEEIRYPTEKGIAIPLGEIELPPTNLYECKDNKNNHHNAWTRRTMGQFAITRTLRDLARHQFTLYKDQHNWLHKNYAPPDFPTPLEALDEVMEAYELDEPMKIYIIEQKQYVEYPISENLINQLKAEYEEYK